jgi:alkanesulfonate monooxygenase SsuD/methylene tetrahydromethanopterin reductase-like flavin-dependent oxidoreductase (luciferase family)
MITRFGSLYAGHVDLDNIGLDGTPVNERWLPDEHLATVLDKTEAIVTLMDRVGYNTFWAAEHRFQREGYECIPNLLLLFVHLAHITKQIKLGCGFNVTPMWHPLRLAEDFAVADRLTGGRIIFGVGRGYHSRECEVLGAPSTAIDNEANRELFEDQVDILFKAFNSRSFSHYSKYYTIPPRIPYRGYELQDVTLVPKPRTVPVECWQPIVSASERAMNFMAKYSIKGIIGGGAASGGANEKVVQAYRDALIRHGREAELGTDLIIGFSIHIAETEQKAIAEARPYFEENMKMFGPLGFVRGLTDEQVSALADPKRARSAGLPTLEQAVKAGAWLVGPPELIIEKIQEVQERYPGLEEINVGSVIGTPQKVICEQLETFAAEVMPTFKNQVKVGALAD